MHIEIVIDTSVVVGSREGPGVPLADVANNLVSDLPGLLTQAQHKTPPVTTHDVQVSLYQFSESEPVHPMLHITVKDIDPSIQQVITMPYDKVWRVIINWFSEQRLALPPVFRYDTGDHGMLNYSGKYYRW